MAVVTKNSVSITNHAGKPVDKKVFEVNWNAEAAEKGGFEHFMLKEIHEQPKAVRATLSSRISKDGNAVVLEELGWNRDFLESIHKMNRDVDIFFARLIQKTVLEIILRLFSFFFRHWSDLPKILEA